MAKSSKYTLGTRSNEIISVPLEILSVRLKDGTFLGPRLYTGEDGKKHIENGYSPLAYNQKELDIILQKAWNRRRGSLLQNIEQLKNQIASAGRILDPLEVIIDGPYVSIAEGHRRHISARWLQLEGSLIQVAPAIVYTAGYGDQGNYENFEYQMWYRNVKEPLSLMEKYDFIQEKLSSGMNKDAFCKKVGIETSEFDSIMLIAGQPAEVRELVEQNLISPTTLKLAKAASERNEWTQQQFEEFIKQSVKLAEELGKPRVSKSFMETVIKDYQPEDKNPPPVVKSGEGAEKSSINQNTTQSTTQQPPTPRPPRLKIKPTAKEIEELFYEIMFKYTESAVEENDEVIVYFPKELAQKMEDYWNRIPEKIIEKLRKQKG